MNNTLKSILMVAGFAAVTISAQAGSVGFFDDSFDLKLGSSALTSLYESKFGTWNAGTSTFTPLLGNAAIGANAGYADATPGALEWAITVSQNNNKISRPAFNLPLLFSTQLMILATQVPIMPKRRFSPTLLGLPLPSLLQHLAA